jgi:hypothetical protein
MNFTALTILFSGITGFFLTLFGTYIILANTINPSGNLLEGLILFSLGILMILMVVIANAIGKAMISFVDTFSDIIKKHTEINSQQSPSPHFVFSYKPAATESKYHNISLSELKQLLTNAIETDNFEEAKKINEIINKIKNDDKE